MIVRKSTKNIPLICKKKHIQALLHVTRLFHFATPTGGRAQFCSQFFLHTLKPFFFFLHFREPFPHNRSEKQWKVWNQSDGVQARSQQKVAQRDSSSLATSWDLSILIVTLPLFLRHATQRSIEDVNVSRRSEEPQVYPIWKSFKGRRRPFSVSLFIDRSVVKTAECWMLR